MSEQTEIAPYTLPRYTRQWVYTFLALAVAFTFYFKIQYPLAPSSPRSQDTADLAQESYWFFALQLPNPKPGSPEGEFYQKNSDWFNSLRRAGFHPMLLSEVRSRMTKGQLLPERTIVLSIDEALLTTYNAYEPLLKDYKFPVVLVTSMQPLRAGDHGYLSYNAVKKLPDTGFWDVIFLDDHSKPQLQAPLEFPIDLPLPPGVSPWSSSAERSLANQLPDLRKPRRLSIDWQWSGQDLVNRLEAETPVHPHGSRLTARQVLDHLYGVVLPNATESDDRFSLAAFPDQRGKDLSWLGTRGVHDYQLHFSIEEVTGQVWFLLRSTGDRGDNIRVGFSDGKVIVKEQIAGHERLLGMTDWASPFPWTGSIQLRDSELRIAQKSQTIMVCQVSRSREHQPQAMLQVMVYDQLYGAAQARNMSLTIEPLLSLDTSFSEGLR